MSGVATAIGVGAIGGALITSNATKNAASAQADAANNANQLQWNMYQQNRTDNQPMLDARNNALSQLQGSNGIGSFNYQNWQDPGYQFRLQAGQDAINRASANRGGSLSGSNLQALNSYGQQSASQEYQNAYNRYQSNLGNYMSLAGLGQNAGAQTNALGSQTASSMGSNLMNAANGQAAAGISAANSYSGALNGLGNSWMQYSMLNKMYPSSSLNSGIDWSSTTPIGTDMSELRNM